MDADVGYGEKGYRRKKLAGYLKAANELRQSYSQAYGLSGRDGAAEENESSVPGGFPDVSVVRNGDEEMLLFPSYANRHRRRKGSVQDRVPAATDLKNAEGSGDAEYWRKEYEKHEDQNAVVDVNIRGWLYAPHKGQMTRKNRILVGIARHLSGIPAPSSSRAASPSSPHHARVEARTARHEDELAEREAESIERKGRGEADMAWRGGYSEKPSSGNDEQALNSSPEPSRESSLDRRQSRPGPIPRPLSTSSINSIQPDHIKPRQKRRTWNQPSEMSPEELSVANAHLMVRLKPFLTTPLVSTPLTVFFYNEASSKSRTITTNESGHFSLSAPLDFVPTHVRVLASDKLSATEEVRITEPHGISMISDIDDTIKHSAIGSGAKEIFRNAFIRDLGDLTIEGVREWYTTLSDMGVKLHYVSNSPWQLYPVLTSFFAQAGLPNGSFHLKQYTGMLQGIFEPVAERKKGTLEKIMDDFPERRFILVGDSGEADLELYTDIMLANPGRILGVYIRDVTTSPSRGLLDAGPRSRSSVSSFRGRRDNSSSSISPKPSTSNLKERPPMLPPRKSTSASNTPAAVPKPSPNPAMGTLIDFSTDDKDKPIQKLRHSMTDPLAGELTEAQTPIKAPKSPPPSKPAKPLSLRPSPSSNPPPDPLKRKPAPPPPRRPGRQSSSTSISTTTSTDTTPNLPTDPSPLSQIHNLSSNQSIPTTTPAPSPQPKPPNAPPSESSSYSASVRNKVASAYNSLPSWYPPNQASSTPSTNPDDRPPPPIPPRRNITSVPSAVAGYATSRLGGADPTPTPLLLLMGPTATTQAATRATS
ncbi:MAG: hypothetical protein OHK93_005840 [Ramalina farinacea]|uniref:Phosphatidate phosphatase APP1 catalytic domain-containing protein n=1 Tax=Ramalina farinacea TaxID=258253 RepID=A0AA43QKX6_9LECA|nr:hypothetical protein [Ramalina farinacea]